MYIKIFSIQNNFQSISDLVSTLTDTLYIYDTFVNNFVEHLNRNCIKNTIINRKSITVLIEKFTTLQIFI